MLESNPLSDLIKQAQGRRRWFGRARGGGRQLAQIGE